MTHVETPDPESKHAIALVRHAESGGGLVWYWSIVVTS